MRQEEDLKRRNYEWLKRQEEIKQEAAKEKGNPMAVIKSKPMPRPARPPPQSKQSAEGPPEPDKTTYKSPPKALQKTQDPTPTSPSETTEEPPMAPDKPKEDTAMESVQEGAEELRQDEEDDKNIEEEGPAAEGPEEEEEDKKEDDPLIDPDHQPIKDDKKDNEDDDDDPRPDGGGSKISAPENTSGAEALGASAKSKPQEPPPDHFDCVDDIDFPELDYDLDHNPTMDFERVPSTDEELVEMEVDDPEEEMVEVEVEGNEEEEPISDNDEVDKGEEDSLPVNPFDPTNELDLRRFDQSHVRTVTYRIDKRRLSSEDLGFLTYKSL